jgi:replicative DNA helicase Mcm
MTSLLIDESLKAKWKRFFEERCKPQLETIALSYPEKRSLCVDFDDIDRYSSELTDGLLKNPLKNQFNAEEALKEIDTARDSKMALHFRVVNLPEHVTIPIRKLFPQHLYHLISIEGTIVRRTHIENKLLIGAFQCQKCGAIIKVEQKLDAAVEPSECYKDQGGCERESHFELVRTQSTVVAWQKLQVQENPEALRGGLQPQKITVFLEDDLTSVDMINSGNRVRINGVLLLIEKRREKESPRVYDFGINTWSYEVKESTYEDIQVTDEDIEEIVKASKDPLSLELFFSVSLHWYPPSG